MTRRVTCPVVVAGAIERHNFGDLLMGRIVGFFLRQRGLTPLPASLLAADLRRLGGDRVHSFADLAPHLSPGVPIVHVGGETIPCSLRDGLRMNVPPRLPRKLAAMLASEVNPSGLESRKFAYLTPPTERIRGRDYDWAHRFYHGHGASTLDQSDESDRRAIGDILRGAEWLTAREDRSVAALRDAGAPQARFAWDCAVLAPCLEAEGLASLDLWRRPDTGGYLLVHGNADFLAENTASLVRQIAAVAGRFSGVRIGLAGLAANHDTVESACALAEALAGAGLDTRFLSDPHVESIVAGIKEASCVVSTSLHYRILALSHGVPRVSLTNTKTACWAASCDPDYPSDCPAEHLADAVGEALARPESRAKDLAMTARAEGRASLDEMVNLVAGQAGSPEARCHFPEEAPEDGLSLPPDHLVAPRAWIDALADRCEMAAAAELELKQAREELRQSRDEPKRPRRSAAGRLARFIKGL